MGLDISLVRHKGFTKNGYLDSDFIQHPKWEDRRLVVRHKLWQDRPFEIDEKTSGIWGDFESYSRPKDMEEFKKWIESLNDVTDEERAYLMNIHNILLEDEDYHLEFNF